MSKKKNLNLSKSSLFRIKSYKKTVPSFEQFAKSSLGAFLEKISEQKQQVLKNIGQTWHMVSAMGMEGIKQSILKYLKKLMDEKAYQHREIIMELLRNGSYPKEEKPNKDFNFKTLKAEIENLKEQLESYLLRRFSRDIQIIQQRIHHSDDLIKDLIDLSTYQKLICSFRPALISNPTDIPRELQDISRATATAFTYFNHIQQLRYDKLANVEKDICQSHALRCREKLYSRQVLDF